MKTFGLSKINKIVKITLASGILASTFAKAENLQEIYQQAAKNDPQIIAAQANLRASLKGLDIAESVLLPQINATLGYSDSDLERDDNLTNQTGDITSETTSANINLVQQIYHHDSWLNLSKTEKQVKQAELLFETAQQGLIVRTVSAYLDVLSAKDDLEFVTAEKKAIERQLEQTKQRFSVGLTAITDVHEAQAQFDNAVAQEISAENDVELALESLREITGGYYPNLDELNTERFSPNIPTPSTPEEWVKLAENLNKDVNSRKIGKDIAKQEIDIATAGHYPTADLTAGYQWSENEGDNELAGAFGQSDYEQDGVTVGIQLSVPLYTGGRTSALVEQAQHNYVVASQQLEQTYRTTVRTVRNSFNTVKASISRITAFKQSVVSAESALKATEAGFEVGTRTIVDVLNSTRNLYDAKRNLSNARYGYIRSMLELKQAAGNLNEEDILLLNRGLSKSSDAKATQLPS
ncbi:outer membrane channel protein TolC [Catenovulum sp. SM1970]|uniref:outer membrane channel protein TolC n=1 Tax=Marinifaba aquimaris TaxID=2741323 RepID=UPI00157248BB|nr:outer membrane channel protein TolC [Marinifaba aquimaris]NTS77701.1 outer membrane channel protein TolC [Marinifaba aquimaris]